MLATLKQFLVQEIGQQRKSLFLWSPVAIGLGIVTYFATDIAVSWTSMVGIVFLLILAISKSVSAYAKTGRDQWLWCVLISIGVSLFCVGYGASKWRTDYLSTPILEDDLSPSYVIGTIEKLVALDGGKAKRVVLNPVSVEDQDVALNKIRLKTYHFKGNNWELGDVVRVRAKLMAPSGPVMPGGFDFRLKAYYEGLSAVGYTMGDAELLTKGEERSGHVQPIRDIIAQKLYTGMESRFAGIAQALLTGERAGIAENDAEALRASGLAHLLAISGLHIGLVAGCVFFFVRLGLAVVPNLALYHPIKKYAAVCAIIVAFVYMILAGATVPTLRAFIMTSLVLLAIILDRSAMNMRLVAVAAIIVMLTTPEAVMGPSFVLSFSAVTALIAFYQGVGRKWLVNAQSFRPLWRPVYYMAGIIATTIVATLATAPFSVMFFNHFAVYSVLANVAAMPIMGFIVMPFGLLAILVMPIGLDQYIWPVMEWGITKIVTTAHAVAAYDYASLYLPSFSVTETVLLSCGFLMIVLWRGYLRWIGVPVIIGVFLSTQFFTSPKILISEKMDAILIVDQLMDKPYLIGKMNSYLERNWLGSLGYAPDVEMSNYQQGEGVKHPTGYCDDMICRLNFKGVVLTILNNPSGMQTACYGTDILIARIPIKKRYCSVGKIIDRFDVWRHGAMTVTIQNGRYHIETVK